MAFRKPPSPGDRAVLVVGLGRFGAATARSLIDQGWDVVAIDENPELVQKFADDLTYTASSTPPTPRRCARSASPSSSGASSRSAPTSRRAC